MIKSLVIATILSLSPNQSLKVEKLDTTNHVIHIYNDPGGYVAEYRQRIEFIKTTKIKMQLHGDCYSACTLYLDLLKYNRICAYDDSYLYFHQARTNDNINKKMTLELFEFWPEAVQNEMKKHDIFNLKNNEWISIKATEVIPEC